MKSYRLPRLALVALLVLCGCSGNQPGGGEKAAKPAAKPTEALTGREAFQKLYVQARGWAPDAKPVRMESAPANDFEGHNGKAAIWRGSFASSSRGAIKLYLWSGSSAEGAGERGVSASPEDTWSPNNSSAQAFDVAFLKVDSDKAWDVAQGRGGEKLLKTDARQPVQYTLNWNPLDSDLVWHVVYGTSTNTAKLRVAVNASDGKFIRVEK